MKNITKLRSNAKGGAGSMTEGRFPAMDHTMSFRVSKEEQLNARDVLLTVYSALVEKGYNPINQLVGYLISGDPAYITSYKQARTLIKRVERDDLIEEVISFYVKNIDKE